MPEAQILLVSDDATLGKAVESVLARLPNCRLLTMSHADKPLKVIQSQDADLQSHPPFHRTPKTYSQ